jgi:hypothetical protein
MENIQKIRILSYNLQNFNSLADNYCEKVQKLSLFFTTDQIPDIQISEDLLQLSRFVIYLQLFLSKRNNKTINIFDLKIFS